MHSDLFCDDPNGVCGMVGLSLCLGGGLPGLDMPCQLANARNSRQALWCMATSFSTSGEDAFARGSILARQQGNAVGTKTSSTLAGELALAMPPKTGALVGRPLAIFPSPGKDDVKRLPIDLWRAEDPWRWRCRLLAVSCRSSTSSPRSRARFGSRLNKETALSQLQQK